MWSNDVPCTLTTTNPGLVVFIILGVFSHARGVVLLVREARLWLRERQARRNGR